MARATILITGATGFIGSHVATTLLRHGLYRILAIVRRTGNYKNVSQLKEDGAVLFPGYFADPEMLKEIFGTYTIDSVVHLAALRGAGAGTADDYRRTNVLGTEVLLQAALENRVRQFIYCSSVGVHGTVPVELPTCVNSPLRGDNAYHASKIAAEQKVNEYIERGLNAYIVRPTITYGPADNGFSHSLISLVRRKMFLLPRHEIRIHLLNVHSFAALVMLILQAEHVRQRVFLVADEGPIVLRDLVNAIHRHYHGRDYPPQLKIPTIAVRVATAVFHLLHRERWETRLSLVYRSWYYDIAETVRIFGYVPSSTKQAFLDCLTEQGNTTLHNHTRPANEY